MAFDGIKNGHISIESSINEITGVNKTATLVTTLTTKQTATLTVNANEHYLVPTSLTVTNASYKYDYSSSVERTATVTITPDGKGDVYISGNTRLKEYSVNFTPASSVYKVSGSAIGTIESGNDTDHPTLTYTISINSGYAGYTYPSAISVTPSDKATLDFTSGSSSFTLKKLKSDITLTYTIAKIQRQVIAAITGADMTTSPEYCEADTAKTVEFTLHAGYSTPTTTPTVSNAYNVSHSAVAGGQAFNVTFTPDTTKSAPAISGSCVRVTWAVTDAGADYGDWRYIVNGEATDIPERVEANKSHKFRLIASTGYKLATQPTITGGTNTPSGSITWEYGITSDVKSWDITVSNITSDLTLNAYTCTPRTWSIYETIDHGSVKK